MCYFLELLEKDEGLILKETFFFLFSIRLFANFCSDSDF